MKSELINELAAALSKAQGQLAGAVKDSSNPFFKSRYADLSSVVEALRQPFANNGLSYIQTTESHPDEVRVETILMHSSGQWISTGTLNVPVTKSDAQGYGSALTYARRYSLCLLGVAPIDDDGNAAVVAKPIKVQAVDLQPMLDAQTLPDLQKAYQTAYKTANDEQNTVGMAAIIKCKNERKNALTAPEAA
ncbi:MAG: Pseudoalteromonas phage Pq0 [Pseudomonadota bacterium]|jgi:hypothetical protein